MKFWITVEPNGHVIFDSDIEMHTDEVRVAQIRYDREFKPTYLALRVPGRKHWNGRGSQRYAPAEIWFCEVLETGQWKTGGRAQINVILSTPVRAQAHV